MTLLSSLDAGSWFLLGAAAMFMGGVMLWQVHDFNVKQRNLREMAKLNKTWRSINDEFRSRRS